MAVSDAVVVAAIAASGTLGAGIYAGSVALYGHWTKKRGDKASADKTEQEVEIRWHEEWEKECAENKRLREQHESERREWAEEKAQLTRDVQEVRGEIDKLGETITRATTQLTDCQNERLDLSRLATALHADRNRWREAAKSYKFLYKIKHGERADENLVMQAEARIIEAEQGEEAVTAPDIVDTAVSIIAINTPGVG